MDFGDLKSEMNIMTKYLWRLLDIISHVPIECKYYFLEIQDYNRCFVAIRKIVMKYRTEYNNDEEPIKKLFKGKFKEIKPNIRKKFFRPSARKMFYFLDRKIPFDLVMLEVIKLSETLRDEKVKNDPIMQTKNTDMLHFISSLKHQCTLMRNLIFSYLYNISKLKAIFNSFKDFFDQFSDFDKDHGDFYEKAKNATGNEDFNAVQGIDVREFTEEQVNVDDKHGDDDSETEEGKDGIKDDKDEEEEQISEKSRGSDEDDATSEDSSESDNGMNSEGDLVLPENLGRLVRVINKSYFCLFYLIF
jgi:hypothetical protein